jgi:hypothetical protein
MIIVLSQYESINHIKYTGTDGHHNNGIVPACQYTTGQDVINSINADETSVWQLD